MRLAHPIRIPQVQFRFFGDEENKFAQSAKGVTPSLQDPASVHKLTSLKTIDLFCGAGGITEGFRQEGYRSLYGNDAMPEAIETFALNHPSAISDPRRIEETDPFEVRESLGLQPGELFFSNDCAEEFADIFERQRLPAAPTVYVCAQDRGDDGVAPGGAERLLMIVNAPATGDTRPFTPEELTRCEAQTFKLMARCGLQVQRQPEFTQLTTPQGFEQLFPATGGALYGQASHGWAASFSRPGARSRLPGLYLAGGSVHPGPGVPMAALSGRQAAASVMADRPAAQLSSRHSTSPLPPAVTPGGTSTR